MKPKFTFTALLFILFGLVLSGNATAQWNFSNKPTGNNLNSVFYINGSNIWTVGDGATILNYDGNTWNKQNLPILTNSNLRDVFFIDKNNAWAGGDDGLMLKYNGSTWKYSVVGSNFSVKSLFFLNANQGWAVGSGYNVYFYNGTTWTAQALPNYSYLNAVYFVDSSHGWAVGYGDNGAGSYAQVIYKYNGTSWTLEKTVTGNAFNDVFMLNATTGWAVGDNTTIYKYNGSDWVQQASGDPYTYNSFKTVKFKDANNGWALNNSGGVFKYNGTSWASDTTLYTSILDFTLTETATCWAVGEGGNIFKKENSKWSSLFSSYNNIQKVKAVDKDNQWLLSGTQILRNKEGQWVEEANAQYSYFNDAFFLDANNGWAINQNNYWRYDGSSWVQKPWTNDWKWYYLYSIYFTDTAHGWAVGYNGAILKYNMGKWQEQKSYTQTTLRSVFFADSTRGWAVGDSGVILSYANNAWTKMSSNYTKQLLSVYFTDPEHGWAVGAEQSILKYQDRRWTTYATGYQYYNNNQVYFKGKNGWIVGDNNNLLKFDGNEWIKQPSMPGYNSFNSVAFADSVNGWITTYNNVFSTTNGGTPSENQSSAISVIGTQNSPIWSADTIRVLGNITVNGDLIIRPGVRVEFEGNYSVNINNGVVKAIGTKTDPINFTVHDTILTGSKCGWSNIMVYNYGNDTSKFKYCKFSNSNYVPLYLYNGYIDVANNYFTKNSSSMNLYSIKGGRVISNIVDSAQNNGFDVSNCKNIVFGGNSISHTYYGINFSNSSGIILDTNVIAFNRYLALSFSKTDFTLRNSKICNNVGGAIYITDSKANIINSLISNNNFFSTWDGGSYYSGAIYMINSQINMLNSVVSNNAEGTGYGHKGGALFFRFTNGNIYNSIIWNNKQFDETLLSLQLSQVFIYNNGSKPNFYSCDIDGGSAAFKKAAGVTYSGTYLNNLNANPLFVLPTTKVGYGIASNANALTANWRVGSTSLCINGGTSSIGNMVFPDKDLANNKRILNGVVDIGAYENRIPPFDVNCGIISSNTEWAADTVRIKGCNLVINSDKVLQIKAGTLVEFWGPYKIIVKGAIKAIGSESEPIRFTIHDTTGFATLNTVGWQGIEFDNSNGDMDNSDSSIFRYCVFEKAKDTSSYYYSGIGMFGLIKAKFFSKLAIQNSLFKNNFINIPEYWYSAGLVCLQYANNVRISNNKFINNQATVFNFESSNTLISGNTIAFNTPSGQYKNVMNINSSDCLFENNMVANNVPGNYAAVVNTSSSGMKFVNNVFANNLDTTSSNYQYTIMGYGGSFMLSNNTVVNNFGNSVYFYNGTFKSVNNILWGNRYESSYYSLQEGSVMSNCIIQNFWWSGEQYKNIISEDPKFISPSRGSGFAYDGTTANWGLTYFSPAINAGSADTLGLQLRSNDIAGKIRINGDKIDIGAYEHQGAKIQYLAQPVGVSYCTADSAVLTVNVNDVATFQWQKDGQDILDANGTTLILKDLKESSSGNYICIANNAYGKTYSNPAFVQVKSKPEIMAQPVNRETDLGSTLAVEVMVSGTKPITYSWTRDYNYYNPNGGGNYGNGGVAGGSSLSNTNLLNFPAFSYSDEGRYQMVASNSCGTAKTDSFNIIVKPVATIMGNDTLFCEGEYISITASTGMNNSLQWYKNGVPITGYTWYNLELKNISKSDEGNYSFTITNKYGTYSSNVIYLSIHQRPEILSQPVSRWVENQSAFTCEVSAIGAKPLTYQWIFGETNIEGEKNPRFILAGFGQSNEGTYKCKIENVCGTLYTEPAAFYIIPSVAVSGADNSGVICENSAIELSIVSDNNSTFQWYKDGFAITGATNSILKLAKVSANDQGNYSCLIAKTFGSMQTTPRFISVQTPPEKIVQPSTQWFKSGAIASAEMSVLGSKPIQYSWFKNDTALNTETAAKIIFTSFTAANQGVYYCKAENSCGKAMSDKISFLLKPQIILNTSRINGVVCTSDTISLEVTASPNASFQWFKDGILLASSNLGKLVLNSVGEDKAGNYSCSVTTEYGTILTDAFAVSPRTAPQILVQPSETWVNESARANISISTIGSKPISYEWFAAGVRVDSSLTGKLIIDNVLTAKEGLYSCKVSNACGFVTSDVVGLYVLPKICLVTADEETGKNVVVWERKANRNIKGYNVYRESVVRDLYEKIGFVSYTVPGVFVDSTSTPELHQNLYKIAAVGANDAISPMSNYHKTLFLQYVSSQGGVNLMWQPYEIEGGSIEFKSYVLYKGTDPNNLKQFATVSSSLQVYTDTAKASLTEVTYYRVKGVLYNACNSQKYLKAGGGPFVEAVSNIEDNRLRVTNIAGANGAVNSLSLYPQPASSKITASYILKRSGAVTFEIVDILGSRIATIQVGNGVSSGNTNTIDLSKYNLQNGIYFLKVKANDEIMVKQFIILK